MKLNANAETVLKQRYLIKDENGNPVETVDGMFHRVAKAIASADALHDEHADTDKTESIFYDMMTNLEFLPNSPTLMNAGRDLGQLSACFVLPVEDSMESIFEAIKQAALIHKSGGGTGFSFSRLRQEGSTVNSTGGVASGPISFMKVFNMATEAIKQGGSRRGANMGILRIDHPDILKFIDCKADNTEITNFNLSVGLTEEFMKAAEAGKDYDLVDPHTGETVKQLNARTVFNKIVDAAWRNGEPGIIFLDRLNRDNIVPEQGKIEATNPCGEQPLLPHESCNLGSINLTQMVKAEKGRKTFDWEKLERTVKQAVHFLDNVIEVNKYPLDQIEHTTKQTRKIGLGVMGWADSLLMMGIPYNTEEAVQLAEEVMSFITEKGRQASQQLAEVRGTFPLFEQSILPQDRPQRNGTITTIAPTGTLSIIGGCSSGVEPVFAYVFIRNIMDGTEMLEVNPILKEELEKRGLYSEGLMRRIAQEGAVSHIKELPEDIRRVFVSTHDISPEYHVRMQAAFQRHTDNAVSKTVNFSNEATREDVAKVYSLAFTLGCKGVTIYRDGSRDEQVLNIGKVKRADQAEEARHITPRPRPDVVTGVTERVKIGCGNLYITVNYDEQGICEIFTNTGKAGGCPSQSEATARLASVALRSGIDVNTIIDQLRGIRCPSTIRQHGLKCTSCPDAIARVIEQEYEKQVALGNWLPLPDAIKPTPEIQPDEESRCPECGSRLEHESGCVICRQCGYSKCG
ncbi:vitamin B12-dependent ribonucleotide reductase [Ihubacter massiliensis]|uniref:Vitamin B12-dependent ribonucleotide reductase n=1 Tax=Hominibacterium faecale TaxID=2839743 RepID=A0A9J6QUR4_9FIRM|nr:MULTISPECIES: vitamin B12-dependent ribonucleotide reductase [Eubacteriales Family XIII. Incertae Sedis]MCI7302171.1 vitamin B12-dependent ribonucleotide reductase [Clostridia bacterium]MCO7121690.1 vitamin B12-dependent ribonucleotide reductase [Ihubacter massiliensis]MCU7378671.1 vitamin B12-dependent ribonucleotide reductase [Hominibacterium faecale]MDY3010573.1 vitamin B12-dependent ribonucleotide reductase [Clostridiales Family XIII bacterium]